MRHVSLMFFVKTEIILVRYGEIALKGKETRKRFENSLVTNMRNALNSKKLSFKIQKERGRIYVYTKQIKETIHVLKKVFGITSMSPVFETETNMDLISDLAVKVSKKFLTKKSTFAVRVKRTGNHNFSSQDVAIRVGKDIADATKAGVNLTKPDFELFIEIRDTKSFIFVEKIRGTGGMPLGTQGTVLVLVDSPQSILSAWYLMRRGCRTIFLTTDEMLLKSLGSFTNNWFAKTDIFLNDNQTNLYENMEKIAKSKNCDAIVTGHSFSNTIEENISKIKIFTKNITLPVLHPLIAMEKNEIDEKCKTIGINL